MKATRRLLGALAGVLFAVHPHVHAAGASVEETVVGPADAGGVYVLSPSGGHVAYAGLKGTRSYVSVDGVAGPEFDELYTASGASFVVQPRTTVARSSPGGANSDPLAMVIFSPDGAHYAYAGRQGNEIVVMHDGKEVARAPREKVSLNYGSLTLSPRGRVVYFMEMDRPGGGNAKWRLNMNGKTGPWFSNNNGISPVFNADESRHAYNATSESDWNQPVLIVDGKVASYAGMKPVFSGDGKSLFSISVQTANSPKPSVLVDGKPAISGLSVDKIIPAPAGRHWGAIVRTRMEGYNQVSAFFLDGREIPGTEGAQQAWFSADGAHYAVACQNMAARTLFMVVDGKPQREYQSIGIDNKLVRWTADGSKFIYTITAGGRPFLVVNGEEVPITMLIGYDQIAMSDSGSHYGYGLRDGSNRNHALFVDGTNVLPDGLRPYDNTLVFSPDGAHYGFFAGPAMRNEMTTVVIDGAVQEGITPQFFQNWVSGALVQPSVVFSPDGRHVAYMGANRGARGFGVMFDNKAVTPQTRSVFFPTFTADSNHLYWVEDVLSGVQGQPPLTTVMLDGDEVVRADGRLFWPVAGSFTTDAAGVATFFAADGKSVKRYRITPTKDTSLATLTAKGEQLIADAAAAVEAEKARIAEQAAAAEKAKQEAAAKYAQAKAEQQARAEAAQKARQEAYEAKRKARLLQLENAKRKRQGLPPLTELPEGN